MARKKGSSSSRFPIGNREMFVEGPTENLNCKSKLDSSKISPSGGSRIKLSVLGGSNEKGSNDAEMSKKTEHSSAVDGEYILVKSKDADSCTKSVLQEVLNIYKEELPTMKTASNTGKASTFLERCVLKGKYCTLILRLGAAEGPGQVASAITYQIVATDTQYAEIPVAAVRSRFQHKGVGQLMYLELRRRLQDVGISTILCWGDKESEGFWLKQNFTYVAEVNSKGRVPRLPIKADVRRALCFPGGSLLMISHLNKNNMLPASLMLNLPVVSNERKIPLAYKKQGIDDHEKIAENDQTSNFDRNGKRTAWETSTCSLKSKRVKASLGSDSKNPANSNGGSPLCSKRDNCIPVGQNKGLTDCYHLESSKYCWLEDPISNDTAQKKSQAGGKSYAIMLMDIADGSKKAQLTKIYSEESCESCEGIYQLCLRCDFQDPPAHRYRLRCPPFLIILEEQIIEDLGGAVTADGRSSSHVLTARVRRTLNYCTALCSGAWILSPSWLKESSRQGRFVDEISYILVDALYTVTLKVNLKEVVLRAKESPGALLRGYKICLTAHVHPPIKTLSAIIQSAGGAVIRRLDAASENFKTIFLTCEEDMEEALLAARKGVKTFSIDWFMNCVLKQVLDLDAPQFAVSL